MLDFKKLEDPAFQEQLRIEREAQEAESAARTAKQKEAVSICLGHIEELADTERGLVRNCQQRLSTYGVISDKQETWLFDIAKRFA
jgi:predicted component of type VI protein secretion system